MGRSHILIFKPEFSHFCVCVCAFKFAELEVQEEMKYNTSITPQGYTLAKNLG